MPSLAKESPESSGTKRGVPWAVAAPGRYLWRRLGKAPASSALRGPHVGLLTNYMISFLVAPPSWEEAAVNRLYTVSPLFPYGLSSST